MESDGDVGILVKTSSAALSKIGKNTYATQNWLETCRSPTYAQVKGPSP